MSRYLPLRYNTQSLRYKLSQSLRNLAAGEDPRPVLKLGLVPSCICRCWPLANRFCLLRICMNSFSRHDVPKVYSLRSEQFTFRWFDFEIVFGQMRKYSVQFFNMGFDVFGKDNDIVQVYEAVPEVCFTYAALDKSLKRCWSVTKTERNTFSFVEP